MDELGGWPALAAVIGLIIAGCFQIATAKATIVNNISRIDINSAKIGALGLQLDANTAALNNMQGELSQMHRLIIEMMGQDRKQYEASRNK